MKAQIFRFVRHAELQSFVDLGWIAHDSLDGTHHGRWSKLIEWTHDEPPREPETKEVPLAG